MTIIDIPFQAAEGRRLLFRFTGAAEYRDWMRMAQGATWSVDLAQRADGALRRALSGLIEQSDFGNQLHDFTNTARGGGRNGPFLATSADLNMLLRSTDDAVQRIIRGAEYVVVFSVPRDACIDGASDLSASEAEVLVPNLPNALCHMVFRHSTNPYNRDQRS